MKTGATRWRQLALMIGVAVVLRLVLAVGVQYVLDHSLHRQFLIPGDAEGYWDLADDIAEGRPYEIYNRYLLRMPGVPLVLAVPRMVFGDAMLPARLVLAILGAAVVPGTYLLGRLLFSEWHGLVAGWYVTFSPVLAGFSVLILSESLFATALVWALVAWVALFQAWARGPIREPAGVIAGIGVGMAQGIAVLMRPTWLASIWILAAAVVLPGGRDYRRWLLATVMIAGVYGTLLPWALRNQAIVGRLVFTTLWVGPSLYDGLNPVANGDSNMQFFEDDRLWARLSEDEVDKEYRRRAWAWAAEHPARVVQLVFLKQMRFWNPIPNFSELNEWWIAVPVGLFTTAIYVFTMIGLWANFRSIPVWTACVFPVLLAAAVHSLFVGSIRYRLPFEPTMAPLAAAGLAVVLHRWRRGPFGRTS